MAVRQDASTGQLVDDGAQQQKPLSGSGVNGRPTCHIKVYSPFRTYYNDDAFSISAISLTGSFDILPEHHNFISLLEPCEMVLDTPHGGQKIKIAGGIMHVRNNYVSVLLDV